MAANPHSNNLELKSIFNLFDQGNSGEIDIKLINSILKNLDGLKYSSITETKNKQKSLEEKQIKLSSETSNNNEQNDGNLHLNLNSVETDTNENIINNEKIEGSIDLKVFPNKKSSINFIEFSNIFNDSLNSKDLQEELLLACFSAFDFNKFFFFFKLIIKHLNLSQGYINSKKIKEVFEIFKDKTSYEEIQSIKIHIIFGILLNLDVLKFVGCAEDKMTFQEFKEFFKKNI